jgi:hypothetical protein
MKNLIKQLEVGFEKVKGKTCTEIIKKVKDIEDSFWTEDILSEEQECGQNSELLTSFVKKADHQGFLKHMS